MKTKILTFAILLIVVIANAQNCFWAGSAAVDSAGGDESAGKGIVTDMNGNVYVTGYFQGNSIRFGSITINCTSPGEDAYYVVKYSADGDVIWAKGGNSGLGYGIALDPLGNIYTTGGFRGATTIFGTTTLTNTSIGYGDLFVAKYDPAGNLLWAKSAGGNNEEFANGITTDGDGNIYITGMFYSSSVIFGSTTINNAFSNCNFFIAKYDSSGNPIWANSMGGSRYEYGNGITSFDEKIYVTGNFQSDSVIFGSYTLHNDAPGSDVLFITCYDTSGSVIWANGIDGLGGSVTGRGIGTDTTGNILVCGGFSSVYAVFGSDTVSGVDNDMYIAKYNSDGVASWAKGAGADGGDYAVGIDADSAGNIYITGYFASNSIHFDDNILNNFFGSSDPDIFVAKYDADGNALWAQKAGGLNGDMSSGIVKGAGNNVYFTGVFSSSPAYFGSVALTPASTNTMFIADIYNFISGISSYTDATCSGAHNGSAITSASEGNLPYTYLWNTNPVQTTASVSNLPAGNYTVTITESYGCAQTTSVTINEPPADSARICMVTSDSLSQYNIIVWDKTVFTSVDSFIVYREIATNNYQPIARIPYNSLSQFVDTTRSLYFPNTGDPNEGTYRYKIRVHNTDGCYSDLSPYHNTIYFLNSNGTFYWTQPYTIENGTNPVTNYVLMRDDNSTGNWHPVASVAGTQQIISDPLYTVFQNTASWRVKTEWSISCVPTLKSKGNFNYSLSNIFTNNTTLIHESTFENAISVYPNPADGKIMVYSSGLNVQSIKVQNILGETMYSSGKSDRQATVEIDISGFSQGVYFLNIKTEAGMVVKKIVRN